MTECTESGCMTEATRRGFCVRCYKRHWKAGTLPPKPEPDRSCKAAADGQCSDDYMGKSLCKRHYYRQYFQGTTELTTLREAPDDIRYRANVSRRGIEKCWPWTGPIIRSTGYGSIHWDQANTSAHIAG